MNRAVSSTVLLLLVALGAGGAARADVVVTITGNVAVAEIALPTAQAPLYTATLRLEFDAQENLTAQNLGIDAEIVDPASLIGRLPMSTTVPAAFPVLVRVEPPPGLQLLASSFEPGEPGSDELGFRRSVAIELRTTQLPYADDSPLRLLRAPLGGSFQDITSDVVAGSVRTRARSGGFSEFVIVDDQRGLAMRALEEYVRLDLRLIDPALEPVTAAALDTALAESRARFDVQDYAGALLELADFDALLAATTAAQVPDRWRARRDLVNARGEIEALSAHLAFLLRRLDAED
jgi:hypothetical protein